MFSSKKKRILAFIFTTLIVAPTFFFLPFTPGRGVNVAQAVEWTWLGNAGRWQMLGNLFTGTGKAVADTATCLLSGPIDCIVHAVFIAVPAFFFGLAGVVFDTLVAFSLSSHVIQNEAFVNKGWVIMRDLSNTFFIFILLYIAISTILQLAGGQTKRLLATLVMVALFMNFSLYITKFVIDVGNVFALEFYVNMGEKGVLTYINLGPNDIEPRSISSVFSKAFDIQTLTGNKALEGLAWGQDLALSVLIGIMYLVAAFVFFSVAFLFLARVVAFWFLMILSPLAFFSMILPYTRGKIWSRWSSELISQSFFAPIFLFFVYLTIMLAGTLADPNTTLFQINPDAQLNGSVGFFVPIFKIFLTFFALITTLLFGLKTAKSMSGAMGESMLKIGGAVGGAAVGTAAFAGRQTVGRGMQYVSDKYGKTLKQTTAGRLVLSGTDKIAQSSFDVRASKIAQHAQTAVGGVNLGAAGGAGGYAKDAAAMQAANKKTGDSLKNNPQAWAKYIASLEKINLKVGDKGVRVNPDRDAMAYWETLSSRDRQEAKAAATGKDKTYLESLDAKLAGRFSEKEKRAEVKGMKEYGKEEREIQQIKRVADLGAVKEKYDKARDVASKDAAKKEAEALLKDMKGEEIAKLDGGLLASDVVAHHLSDKDLEDIERYSSLTKGNREALNANIKANGRPEAQEYLNASPAENRKKAAKKRKWGDDEEAGNKKGEEEKTAAEKSKKEAEEAPAPTPQTPPPGPNNNP